MSIHISLDCRFEDLNGPQRISISEVGKLLTETTASELGIERSKVLAEKAALYLNRLSDAEITSLARSFSNLPSEESLQEGVQATIYCIYKEMQPRAAAIIDRAFSSELPDTYLLKILRKFESTLLRAYADFLVIEMTPGNLEILDAANASRDLQLNGATRAELKSEYSKLEFSTMGSHQLLYELVEAIEALKPPGEKKI